MQSGGTGEGSGFGRRKFKDRPLDTATVQSMFDREPPRSLEAEMSLLGSMILDPRIIGDVISKVKSREDFYLEKHGSVFDGLVEIFDKTNTCDLIQLQDWLRKKGTWETVGGEQYILELANSVPTSVNWPHYAEIVVEKARLRRLISAAGQILFDAYHSGELGPEGTKEVLDKAERAVFDIAQEDTTSEPQRLAELLEVEMQRLEHEDFEGGGYSGVSCGFTELDEILRGFQPGELIIIAARPSMGKTACALNLAEQIAIGGVPVPGAPPTRQVPIAVFSLEMSKNAITQRMLSARSGVSSQMLRGGHKIPDESFRNLMEAADDLKKAPVYVDDTPNITVLQMRARSRRLVAQHGVKCIMIDYLQLMSAPGAARESRQVEVSAISRGVKALARELNVPVICLSQLNRASEQREGNRPRMSDLRESGSIEQDADVIILLHREDYYHTQDEDWLNDPANEDKIGIAELIVAKQRNGPTGIVKLKWDANTTRFRNLDTQSRAPVGFVEAPAAGRGRFNNGAGYNSGTHAGPAQAAAPANAGYASPSQAASNFGRAAPASPFDAPFTPNDPFSSSPGSGSGSAPNAPPRSGFAPGKKSGPISDHRDGGGPDRDAATDDLDIPV
jgi:replicative DNA helicase